MDEYRMARRVRLDVWERLVLTFTPSKVRLDGWCEGRLGQQRIDGGGYVTMYGRWERVESPGAYVTE